MNSLNKTENPNSWRGIFYEFKKNRIGFFCLLFLLLCIFMGLYAPFLASSKPVVVIWNHQIYFPLFRYLFFTGFYTKPIDLFYNLLMFTLPFAMVGSYLFHCFKKHSGWFLFFCLLLQLSLFCYLLIYKIKDPKDLPFFNQTIEKEVLNNHRYSTLKDWNLELNSMSGYKQLELLLREIQYEKHHQKIAPFVKNFENQLQHSFPSPLNLHQKETLGQISQIEKEVSEKEKSTENREHYLQLKSKLLFLRERQDWIAHQKQQLQFVLWPLLRPFHWEENAAGSATANQFLPWYEVTRINRKDLVSAILFGIRISLVVGVTSVALSLLIGALLGMIAGFYAGRVDLIISRLIEIWEGMPTFFMLLLIVAITQSRSIFLVIATLAIFGWTGFARFMRAEVLKQRALTYTFAARSQGFCDARILYSHILPNAIAPLLTLLPFSIMSSITSEAALSFLGLGEEGSCSLGVLMDEGRSVFFSESYLLWPSALVLTLMLISIALVGDAFRDAIDPRSRR